MNNYYDEDTHDNHDDYGDIYDNLDNGWRHLTITMVMLRLIDCSLAS